MRKRVRIAVALDLDGNWQSSGYGYPDKVIEDDLLQALVSQGMDSVTKITMVDAMVEFPEVAETDAEDQAD